MHSLLDFRGMIGYNIRNYKLYLMRRQDIDVNNMRLHERGKIYGEKTRNTRRDFIRIIRDKAFEPNSK